MNRRMINPGGEVQLQFKRANKYFTDVHSEVAVPKAFRRGLHYFFVVFVRNPKGQRQFAAALASDDLNVDPRTLSRLKSERWSRLITDRYFGNRHGLRISISSAVAPRLMHIRRNHFLCWSNRDHSPAVEQKSTRTKFSNAFEIVRNEEHRSTVGKHFLHARQALLLEDMITDTQNLIDDENVGIYMSRDRESEASVHARRIALDGSIDELLDT